MLTYHPPIHPSTHTPRRQYVRLLLSPQIRTHQVQVRGPEADEGDEGEDGQRTAPDCLHYQLYYHCPLSLWWWWW
jgi:hypothetical protein